MSERIETRVVEVEATTASWMIAVVRSLSCHLTKSHFAGRQNTLIIEPLLLELLTTLNTLRNAWAEKTTAL